LFVSEVHQEENKVTEMTKNVQSYRSCIHPVDLYCPYPRSLMWFRPPPSHSLHRILIK